LDQSIKFEHGIVVNPQKAPDNAAFGGESSGLAEWRYAMYDALGLPTPPSRFALVGAAIVRAALWPARVIETRRTMNQLAGMSDFELRDIGLTRQDLADVTARPQDEDPTAYLANARASRARVPAWRGPR
jgi:uncharacterized protein YjiS (DUF1127 family)